MIGKFIIPTKTTDGHPAVSLEMARHGTGGVRLRLGGAVVEVPLYQLRQALDALDFYTECADAPLPDTLTF